MTMRVLLLSVVLLLSLTLQAQKQEFQDKYPNGKIRSEGVFESGFEDGLWKYYFESGQLQEETNYRKGKLHGKVLRYYPNGQLMVEGYFKNDKQDSIQKTYTDKGALVETGYYEKGAKIGRWNYFFPSGDSLMVEDYADSTMRLLSYYEKGGKQTVKHGNGRVTSYFESGRVKSITDYRKGIPHGTFEEYYSGGAVRVKGKYIDGLKDSIWIDNFPSGKPKSVASYYRNILNGPVEEYYPNGNKSMIGQYQAGAKNGYWVWYRENGNKDFEGNFDMDIEVGDWVYWYANGSKQSWGKKKSGELDGEWQYQYPTGEKWRVGMYQRGLKHGKWTTWFENGKILSEGNFENNLEEGEWKSYYDSGKLRDVGHYHLGKMQGAWLGYHPNGVKSYSGEWRITKEENKFAEKWSDLYKGTEDSTLQNKTGDTKFGKWEYWSDKGTPERLETFNDEGVLHGEFVSYAPNGKIESQGKYKEGKPDGTWHYFYPYGSPLRTCTYKEGKLNGPSVLYGKNGKVIEEAKYKDNKLDGEYTSYDEKTGKVIIKQIYENGKSVKVLEGTPPGPKKK